MKYNLSFEKNTAKVNVENRTKEELITWLKLNLPEVIRAADWAQLSTGRMTKYHVTLTIEKRQEDAQDTVSQS